MSKSEKYEFGRHKLSEMFGDMPDDQFQELVADIKKNGLRDPIIIDRGDIIDGWHRYRALKELGLHENDDHYADYDIDLDGRNMTAFVYSKNLFRRQLDAETRVTMAAKALGYKDGRTKGSTTTRADVAALAKVSEATVKRVLNKKDKPEPTLDSLKKRKRMLEGQLASVNEQIAALEKPAKRVRK